MTETAEYAQHWFAHTALRLRNARSLSLVAETLDKVGSARPGFLDAVTIEARKALSSDDRELRHRACAVLAIAGDSSDLAALELIAGAPDSWVAGAARTAAFEIKGRAT